MTKQSHAPTILLTRPLAQSQRFSAELRAALGDLNIVISPLMAAEFLDPALPAREYSAVIFASETAIAATLCLSQSQRVPRKAYCVGTRTAEAARTNGFDVMMVKDDAASLVAAILAEKPPAPLMFLRGEDSTGQVAETLTLAGVETGSAVVYRQKPQVLTEQAARLLNRPAPIILPLFSPRSAGLMVEASRATVTHAPLFAAALSQSVALSAQGLSVAGMEIADHKDSRAMVQAVARLLAGLGVLEPKGGKVLP